MPLQIKKNEVYNVTITGVNSEGNGVAKIDGFTVFVPMTAAGDTASIKVVKLLKHYGFGIVEQLITPSPARMEQDCPVYRQCGGCCYRHITYEEELRVKQQVVSDAFTRIGKITSPCREIVGSRTVDSYRNKAQFPIGVNSDGKAITGFYAPRSHRIIQTDQCRLLPGAFNRIARDIVRFINKNRLAVYQEESGRGVFRHTYLRLAEKTDQVMLCIVSAARVLPKEARLIAFLTERHPEIHTICVNYNPDQTNVILGKETRTIYGSGYITDEICGLRVRISPHAFYQVNRSQAERMYLHAGKYAQLQPDEHLLDLYCGIGTIGLSLCRDAAALTGIEVIAQAVQDAEENARQNGFTHTRFLASDAGKAAVQLDREGVSPDVAVIDPPRKGCSEDTLAALAAMAPRCIVMISCNPSTAARDAQLLQQHGYTVQEYTPYDLFPRTKHVECVILMSKK